MSLIRVLQESRVIKERFSLPVTSDYDMENMKQLIKEKDVILQNNKERIEELENHVAELTEQCADLQKTNLNINNNELEEKLNKLKEYSEMPKIVRSYEQFINEITASHETVKEERNTASTHLGNLEFSFADLVNKYERLKAIVIGYQQNQETLLAHIELYQNAVNLLQERFEIFKKYSSDKLNEAQEHVEKKDKKHKHDLEKLKTKIIQSKVKISELEKKIAILSTNTNIGDAVPDINIKSVFTPLSNKFL